MRAAISCVISVLSLTVTSCKWLRTQGWAGLGGCSPMPWAMPVLGASPNWHLNH